MSYHVDFTLIKLCGGALRLSTFASECLVLGKCFKIGSRSLIQVRSVMILNSAKISKLRNRPRRSPMPTLADPCTIRYNPVSYYLLPASPRVLSSLSCTPVPPWPTQKYQAWFLEPLVENLKSDIGWTRLGVPYLKWTLKISLQMCHRVRMFRQNVKSSEKEWKQGIFITRQPRTTTKKHAYLSQIVISMDYYLYNNHDFDHGISKWNGTKRSVHYHKCEEPRNKRRIKMFRITL